MTLTIYQNLYYKSRYKVNVSLMTPPELQNGVLKIKNKGYATQGAKNRQRKIITKFGRVKIVANYEENDT